MDELTKEELLERAKELDVKGRSGMNKDELQQAVSDAENQSSDSSSDERARAESEVEAMNEGAETKKDVEMEASQSHHSEASNLSNPEVKANLSPEGQEAVNEMGEDSVAAKESDAALDASGPLHLEPPSQRVMTGAVNEAHAKEQEEKLGGMPDNFVGDVTEAGFEGDSGEGEDVNPFNEDGTVNEEARASMSLADKKRFGLVRAEDVIDFPPPVGLREQQAEGGDVEDGVDQKAQLQTDGLAGDADHNLGYAYDLGESGIEDQNEEKQAAAERSDSEASKAEDNESDNSDEGEQS